VRLDAIETLRDIFAPTYTTLDTYGYIKVLEKSGLDVDAEVVKRAFNIVRRGEESGEVSAAHDAFCAYVRRSRGQFEVLMGAMYKFTMDDRFLRILVNSDVDLQDKFMRNVRTVYCLPDDYTYEQLHEDAQDDSMFWDALIKILTLSPARTTSHASGLAFLTRRPKTDGALIVAEASILGCHVFGDDVTHLVTGSNWYGVSNHSLFYRSVWERYHRPILAGSSGSTLLLYNLTFHILNIFPETPETVVLLLAIIVAQYVPLYHTLVEVLMELSDVLPRRYTMDKNPSQFCLKLFRDYSLDPTWATLPETSDVLNPSHRKSAPSTRRGEGDLAMFVDKIPVVQWG
jgi:hypothetical protein